MRNAATKVIKNAEKIWETGQLNYFGNKTWSLVSNSSLDFGKGFCCSCSYDRGKTKSTSSLRPKPGV